MKYQEEYIDSNLDRDFMLPVNGEPGTVIVQVGNEDFSIDLCNQQTMVASSIQKPFSEMEEVEWIIYCSHLKNLVWVG